MKHAVFAISLLLFLLIGCLSAALFISAAAEETEHLLLDSVSYCEQGQSAQALSCLQTAMNRWEEKQTLLGILLQHDAADGVSEALTELLACCQTGDKAEFIRICHGLQTTLGHLREMEWPYLRNIL